MIMNGEQLRKILEKMGMSQGELSRVIGVRPETVWRWVKGRHPIPCATAKLILQISIEKGSHDAELKAEEVAP